MVEIRELVVRAIVVEDSSQRPGGPRSAASSSGGGLALSDDARALLIEDCVRQVLAIVERQTER
jgi:hypothetical protein